MIQYGLQAASGLLILEIGALLARTAGRYTHRTLGKIAMEPPVRLLLIRLVKGLIWLWPLLVVLHQFGIQIFPLIAGLDVAGVGIGWALQGVFLNLFAGLSIIFTKPYGVSEYIEILGEHGEVQNMNLFTTKLKHVNHSIVVILNRKIIGEILHNYGKLRQLHLAVGIAYANALSQALATVERMVKTRPRVTQEPTPVIGSNQVGDSAITISVKPWVTLSDYVPAEAELYHAIVEAFRAHHIRIPFLQREVRMLQTG